MLLPQTSPLPWQRRNTDVAISVTSPGFSSTITQTWQHSDNPLSPWQQPMFISTGPLYLRSEWNGYRSIYTITEYQHYPVICDHQRIHFQHWKHHYSTFYFQRIFFMSLSQSQILLYIWGIILSTPPFSQVIITYDFSMRCIHARFMSMDST